MDTGSFREVEVTVDVDGPRHVELAGRLAAVARARRVDGIHLCLTHDCGQAIANVVLESDHASVPEVSDADAEDTDTGGRVRGVSVTGAASIAFPV
jgi:hypothetical protein